MIIIIITLLLLLLLEVMTSHDAILGHESVP